MRVRWTLAALSSLEEIADYVAQRSPRAALHLAEDIPARVNRLLADNPEIGRVGRVARTRELVLSGTPYIVAYQLGEVVEMLAVMHAAREWPDDFAEV